MTNFSIIKRHTSQATALTLILGFTLGLAGCSKAVKQTFSSKTQMVAASADKTVSVTAERSDLVPDTALITGTLENGLRYAVMPNSTPPGQGALRVLFEAGSLAESDGTAGLAHYLEHMAFNGSENVPEGDMIPILERLGLSFGADTNASTGLEYTTYKLNLPKTTDEILDAAFMLMRETASNLTLDPDAIARELGIILSEKRTRDSAAYRAWEAQMAFATPGSDVMTRLPIGTDESLNELSMSDFRSFYNTNYHPKKTIVVFVGDTDPAEIEVRIRDTFGDWKGTADAAPKALASPALIKPRRVHIHIEDGINPQVRFLSMRPYVYRPDTQSERNTRTIEGLAFAILNERLRTLSDAEDRPFIGAMGGVRSTLKLTEGASLSASIRTNGWEEALRGLDTELRRALKFGFDPLELQAQIRRYDARYHAEADGADTRPTTSRFGGLAESVLNRLAEDGVFTHPSTELERWRGLSETLTTEQINAAFRNRWGDFEDLSVFVQLPTMNDISENKVREVLAENRARTLAAPKPNKASVFAYSDHGAPGKITSRTYLQDEDVYLVTFDNHVALAVKQTNFQEGRVNVQVSFGHGSLSSPTRNEGLRRLSLSVMKESGLEAHTPDELRRIMAGRLVNTTAFTNRDADESFIFSTQTVPDDLRTQLDIFTAQLSAQNFTETARLNHIDKLKAWYPRHDKTMGGIVEKVVDRLIYGDERFGFDNEAQFYTPTLTDVEAWLRPELETGPVEITIVGDINPDTAIKMVAATLGTLPDREPVGTPDSEHVAEMRRVAFPTPGDTPIVFHHRGDHNQSQLRLYWSANDGSNPAYARRLGVLRAVLRNRLVKDIREGEATTYSPGAGSHASLVFDGFGYVIAVLSLKPEDLDAMSDKVRAITDNLAAGNLSEDEFNRAVEPIVGKLDSSEETNPYWMSVLSDALDGGRGLVAHRTRRADYAEMRVEDVRALAAELFKANRALEIRILPKPDKI